MVKLDALAAYKKDNGDCNVPTRDVTENGLKVGTWCNTQRTLCKATTLPEKHAEGSYSNDCRWPTIVQLPCAMIPGCAERWGEIGPGGADDYCTSAGLRQAGPAAGDDF